MSDRDALTPRVFLVRHGATAWAKSGRYTGITDVELTPEGAAQVASTAATLVGSGKVLDPSRITRVFVSPRKRARRTFELLLPLPSSGAVDWEEKVTYTEGIAEWNYGDYEGLKVEEIRELRRTRGLDKKRKWDIWKDGCEGGESMQEVTQRLTTLISQIREIQRPCMNGKQPADVLLVAHGLILRCFAKLWLGFSVDAPLHMMMDLGAITVLSYKNNDIDVPAIHLGMALPSAAGEEMA